MIRVLEPTFNQIEIYFAVYFQYFLQRLKNAARIPMKKYSKDLSTWANNVESKEALENPHNLIRYVTSTDCLEIHQRLHSVGNQRSRERTPCIKLVSRRSSSFSTGVDWKQVTTLLFARKLYFRFFFWGLVNDYSKTKPCKNYQLPINLRKENFILFIQ